MTDPAVAPERRRPVDGARSRLKQPVVPKASRTLLAGLMLGALLAPRTGWACAACYGRSDSPLAAGMNWGIMSLLGCIVLVLGGVAGFFFFLARRSAALARAGAEVGLAPEEPGGVEEYLGEEASEPVQPTRFGGRPALAELRRRCRSGWQFRRKRSAALAQAGFSRTSRLWKNC